MDHFYALIMAGGGGTRLWPLSRKGRPKQMLPLVEEHSMFKISVERLAPLFTPEQVYIVTGSHYVEALTQEATTIPEENFIVEPSARNTASAAALAMSTIYKRDPQATVALLTADHHIGKRDIFRKTLGVAAELAQDGYIVTLGISPSFPATGFGYIQQGEPIREIDDLNTYNAVQFTEKPDVETAARFIASGEYTWNSGMFIWRAETALREFARQQPQLHHLLEELIPTIDTPEYATKLAEIWPNMPEISIDYAVMEGAEKMAVIPVDIGWSDVGSWSSLFEVAELDEAGNHFKGQSHDRIVIDTTNTLVYSDRFTVTIGVEDLIVVDSGDALMICHKDRAQDVKAVVNQLRSLNLDEYL